MFRKLFLAAALAAFATPVAFADDDKKADDKKPARAGKLAGKLDKSKLFETMDADKDGKLSKDEFATGLEKVGEKLKERAADKGGAKGDKLAGAREKIAQRAFEKMDANSDGSISKDEFEKSEFDPSNLKNLREKLGKGKSDK
jgi:EF-hand domain pair